MSHEAGHFCVRGVTAAGARVRAVRWGRGRGRRAHGGRRDVTVPRPHLHHKAGVLRALAVLGPRRARDVVVGAHTLAEATRRRAPARGSGASLSRARTPVPRALPLPGFEACDEHVRNMNSGLVSHSPLRFQSPHSVALSCLFSHGELAWHTSHALGHSLNMNAEFVRHSPFAAQAEHDDCESLHF